MTDPAHLTVIGSGTLPTATVTYCYQVENTGNITLTHHTLQDDQLGLLLDQTLVELIPGGIYLYSHTTTLSQSTTNVATWQATNGTLTATKTAAATVTLIIETPNARQTYLPIVLR